MAEKRDNGQIPSLSPEKSFLGLLTWLGVYGATTFSLYTSRKGRIWCSWKTWGAIPYASAAEVSDMATTDDVVRAGLLSGLVHLGKVTSKAPATDTWYSAPIKADTLTYAEELARHTVEGLLAGKSLEDAIPPSFAQGLVTISTE